MTTSHTLPDKVENHAFDFVVVGGSPGGLSAALMAARCGLSVALVHNRPVLGGNASSEIGVSGNMTGAFAMGYNRHMRETGIIEEIKLKAFFEVHPHITDMVETVFYDLAMRERPRLTLWLNADVFSVETDGRRIVSVTARQIGAERLLRLKARYFADCTGDGFVAAAAGNPFRYGREAASEFGESMAPKVADEVTLGASLLFSMEEDGRPVDFQALPWARRFMEEDAFPHRFHKLPGFSAWWCEHGGRLDPIADHERIKHELLEVIWGLFDHVKNRGPHGADKRRIVRIRPLVGRRESRRVEGLTWLTENHAVPDNGLPDAVCFGGWPIDLHPPDGVLSQDPPADQKFVEPYNIPLRCLLASGYDNLAMAGRHVSITHAALGTTRVIATIAGMGMAIGLATVHAKDRRVDYPALLEEIAPLQQDLLRYDATILDLPTDDPDDLACTATVTASSGRPLAVPLQYLQLLDEPMAVVLPVTSGRIDELTLHIKRKLPRKECRLYVAVYAAEDPTDYRAARRLGGGVVEVDDFFQDTQPIVVPVNAEVPTPWAMVEFSTDGLCYLGYNDDEPVGVTRGATVNGELAYDRGHHDNDQAMWVYRRGCTAFEIAPASRPWPATNAVDGVNRFYKTPHLWMSDPDEGLPAWLTFELDKPTELSCVHLTFDSNLDNPHVYETDRLVRDYRLQVRTNGRWTDWHVERDNRRRKRIHNLPPATTDAVRLLVTACWAARFVSVYEVRLYGAHDRFEL